MARFVHRICPNQQCASHHDNGWLDEAPKASCQIVGMDGANYILQCGKCGHEFGADGPGPARVDPFMRYPRDCQSTGMRFEDKAHERSYAKANKLEAV